MLLSISARPSTTDAKMPRGRRTLIMNLRRSLTITFIFNFHPFFILVFSLYNKKMLKSIGIRKNFKKLLIFLPHSLRFFINHTVSINTYRFNYDITERFVVVISFNKSYFINNFNSAYNFTERCILSVKTR